MRKTLLLIISLILLLSCKDQKQIIVGYDKKYSSTFDGSLSKKVLLDFFKKNLYSKYTFKKYPKERLLNLIETKKIQFALADFDATEDKIRTQTFLKSENLFSDAIYFIINKDDAEHFKYPDSVLDDKIGILYESDIYFYMISNFGKRDNFSCFKEEYNLFKAYSDNTVKIITIARNDYYRNNIFLSGSYLFFIEQGKTYGNIIFSNSNDKKLFDLYFKERKLKEHDWLDLLKPQNELQSIIPSLK
jgi:hypothetical protein